MKFPIQSTKLLFASLALPALSLTSSEAVLVIAGVTDGDLPGGYPKSVIIQAAAPVADLSLWGVGSANNGGGSDGQEFTFPAGSASTGDVFVIAGSSDSFDFFANNFVQNFELYLSSGGAGAANVNGDDAIELFNNGAVFDVYGDPNTNGDGETWDYTDGFATRTGTGVGAFDQANYSTNFKAFDTLDESQHVAIFEAAGFSVIPEPGVTALLLASFGLLFRRRR